jgi:hypothetical protein
MKISARNGLAVLIELPQDAISSRADVLSALNYARDAVLRMPRGAVPLPQPAREPTLAERLRALPGADALPTP